MDLTLHKEKFHILIGERISSFENKIYKKEKKKKEKSKKEKPYKQS
jgi:hypothetical protein